MVIRMSSALRRLPRLLAELRRWVTYRPERSYMRRRAQDG